MRAHPVTEIAKTEVFSPLTGEKIAFARCLREAQTPGGFFAGPMMVIEDQTTIYVPAGWRGRIHALGHVELEREVSSS
nr:hypothetical protein [Marinicella sp. W31]MDC2879735.1 hypothetical protein [Marinicella sp. W31]